MAYSNIKTWVPGEILTASDLNTEHAGHITNENDLDTRLVNEIATRTTLESEHDTLEGEYDAYVAADIPTDKVVTVSVKDAAVTGAKIHADIKDPAAGTAGLRTLGTTGVKAAAGNDSRFETVPNGYVVEAKLGAAAVTQAKLKTSTQTQSYSIPATSSHNFVLTGGQYCFEATIKGSGSLMQTGGRANLTTSYAAVKSLYNAHQSPITGYVLHRYVTSSGEINWLFILRDKNTKEIIGRSIAPDHPCFGNGGKPLLIPHPFSNYDGTKHEIIVINPSLEEIEQMELEAIVDDETKPDKDLLEVITENYEIDENSNPAWPSIPVTVGLPKYIVDKGTGKKVLVDYRFMHAGTTIQPIKKVIPKPEYIKARSLKRKQSAN